MIDMKTTVQAKNATMLAEVEQAEYPYGLRIRLDNDSLKKLGISELPAIDSEHKLVALVCVIGLNMNENAGEGEPNRSVELQIEQMTLSPAKEEDEATDTAKVMFPGMA